MQTCQIRKNKKEKIKRLYSLYRNIDIKGSKYVKKVLEMRSLFYIFNCSV